MTNQLNSGDFSSLEGIEKEMQDFISHIEQGHAPNPGKLLKIDDGLQNLVDNENIPPHVKKELQSALQDLSSNEEGGISVTNLYDAQARVNEALKQGNHSE